MNSKKNNDAVVHPMFDKPEKKCDPDKTAPMEMTKTVRYSLLALRVYLIGMVALALYRMLELAGFVH